MHNVYLKVGEKRCITVLINFVVKKGAQCLYLLVGEKICTMLMSLVVKKGAQCVFISW